MITELNPLLDLTNHPADYSSHQLPLVPDVAVQYRCGDNMKYGNIGYGALPFRAFKEMIPKSVGELMAIALHMLCGMLELLLYI